MKIINFFSIDRVFIILIILYLLFTYIINPYISFLINSNYPFHLKNEIITNITIISISLIIFNYLFTFIIKKNPQNFKIIIQNKLSIITIAYYFFIIGIISKILSIFSGSHLNFEYMNPFNDFFIFKFIFSMNILTLFSIILFINSFYLKEKKFIYYIPPLFYFILDIILVPGGRINILIALIFIIFQYLNSKFNIKKLLIIFLFSFLGLIFFSFSTIDKDVTYLNKIGYFLVNNDSNNFLQNIPEERNFINLYKSEEWKFTNCKVEKHQICQLYKFESNHIIKDISYVLIYPVTSRLNNHIPLNRFIYLKENNFINERGLMETFERIFIDFSNIIISKINPNFTLKKTKKQIDRFQSLSNIGTEKEVGVSPTLIADLEWIGGKTLLILYFFVFSIFLLIIRFLYKDTIHKALIIFILINLLSSFEQTFEAQFVILLKLLILILITNLIVISENVRKKFTI